MGVHAMAMMGIREYSRHRGCTHAAVRKAIASGRIQIVDGKIDSAEADRQWAAATNPAKRHSGEPAAPPSGELLPLLEGKPTVIAPPMNPPGIWAGLEDWKPAPIPAKEKPRASAPVVAMDTFLAAKTEGERARAELLKTQLYEKQRHLIAAEGARQAYWSMGKIVRASIEGAARQISTLLVGKKDPAEIGELLRVAMEKALTQASEEIESRFSAFIEHDVQRGNVQPSSAVG